MNPRDIVQAYFDRNFRVIFWPAVGDQKGPTEAGWTTRQYSLSDFEDKTTRVGVITGQEVAAGRFLHDVDIDWAEGSKIAINFLPATSFVYGRASKIVSHCFYTCPEPLASIKYEDPIDKVTLIELRGTKQNGELGFQSMVPPSVWTKDGRIEPLEFRGTLDDPSHISTEHFKQRVMLAAIGMFFAKRFGFNGFGHEARLAWAGFLLRAGLQVEDLILMGEGISVHCNNREITDVRRVVESTASALEGKTKKVVGGPSLIRLFGNENGKKIIATINAWLGRDQDFKRTEDGKIVKDHQENIRRAITMLGHEISYDEFSDKLLIDRVRPLEDREVNDLWLRIDEEFRFRPTFMFFEKVVRKAGWDNGFHPVREYLNGLQWDGAPRVDCWLIDNGGAEDTDYVRAISRIVLVAAVRRIREPGAKYDELVVLEGEQGINKSSALRALCPNGAWFSDDLPLNVSSQKMIESTLGKWIIEASELAGKKKAEVENLKSTLSRQVDGPARMAYAHLAVERKRQFVIIGTTNSAAYLTDPTGARRFWPIPINRFDVDQIAAHRDQLWAEACYYEQRGESIRLAEELWPDAAVQQEKRREIDPWEDVIRRTLITASESSDGFVRITTSLVWGALTIETGKRDRYGAMRISEIMQRLGFKRGRVRAEKGDVEVGYIGSKQPLLDEDEDDNRGPAVDVPF